MGRNGATTFRDIQGKLAVLRMECTKCDRRGVYHVDALIEQHGLDTTLPEWTWPMYKDCPRQKAHEARERCDIVHPDLSTVV